MNPLHVLVDEYRHGKYDKAEIRDSKIQDKKIVNRFFVSLACKHDNNQTITAKADDKSKDVEAKLNISFRCTRKLDVGDVRHGVVQHFFLSKRPAFLFPALSSKLRLSAGIRYFRASIYFFLGCVPLYQVCKLP